MEIIKLNFQQTSTIYKNLVKDQDYSNTLDELSALESEQSKWEYEEKNEENLQKFQEEIDFIKILIHNFKNQNQQSQYLFEKNEKSKNPLFNLIKYVQQDQIYDQIYIKLKEQMQTQENFAYKVLIFMKMSILQTIPKRQIKKNLKTLQDLMERNQIQITSDIELQLQVILGKMQLGLILVQLEKNKEKQNEIIKKYYNEQQNQNLSQKEELLNFYYLSLCSLHQTNDIQALKYLEQANTINSKIDKEIIDANQVKGLILKLRANCTFNLEKYEEALKIYQSALEILKDDIDIKYNFGCSYNMLEEVPKLSVQYYEKCIAQDKLYYDAYLNLAESYEDLENFKEAEQIYQFLMKSFPEESETYEQYGKFLEEDAKEKQALKVYEDGLKIDDKNAKLLCYSAKVYQKFQKNDKAIQNYELAIKYDPEDSENYYEYGIFLELNDEPEKAMEKYKKCVEIDPKHLDAYQGLGSIYESHFDDIKNCLECYKKCCEIDDTQNDLKFAIAELLMEEGEIKEALEYYTSSSLGDEQFFQAIEDPQIKESVEKLMDLKEQQDLQKSYICLKIKNLQNKNQEKSQEIKNFVQQFKQDLQKFFK